MKMIQVIVLLVVFHTLLVARGEMGGLNFAMVKMFYEQNGKFIMRLPSGEKFDFSTVAHLPDKEQEVAWNKVEKKMGLNPNRKKVKDPLAKAKSIIAKESKILTSGIDQVSGKKPHNKKYSNYIRTNKEIKTYVKKTTTRQIKRQNKACKKGNAKECFNLGKLYYVGVGVAQNIGKAKYYFKRTCSQGIGIGCFYVGKKFATTKKERIKQYKNSCVKGYDAGCTEVGSMYLHGRGTKKDFKQAYVYLSKACSHDDPDGCHLMASIYSFGLGRKKSNALAKKYLRKEIDIRKHPWDYR